MALSPDSTLGRYRIISHLGSGGMGEVYRAKDTLLNREVAIKLLPDHLAKNAEALKRFQKEVKALAAVSHFNILDIHDFVSNHDTCFIVTELLEGETLRQRMAKSQLSFQKAIEIAIGIGEGLAAAHSKGVIHRDLKPENIFLTSQGIVKILDFGLVRFKSNQKCDELTNLETISRETESGIVMGTIPYMSPEQVRGEHVDERSDIFSYGCILYEMLSGKRPFSGGTPAEIAASILRDVPRKLNIIPDELNSLVQHCLEKETQQRVHSAHDLVFLLRDISGSVSFQKSAKPAILLKFRSKMLFAILTLVLVLVAVFILQEILSNRRGSEEIDSIAVLPLKNLSSDPKQEYFADGMTEELISKLAGISTLRVISRTSIMEYKSSHKPLRQIAQELNVDAVIEGAVLQSDGRVRITAQLIHARTDKHLWTESYERDMNDILNLQNEVASAVAQEIRVKLTRQEQAQLTNAPKVKPAAYDAYLVGINYFGRANATGQDTELAINMFEKAIQIDPTFAQAYARLSMGYSYQYNAFIDRTPETLNKAKQAAEQAFKIEPELAEGHLAMGAYWYWGLKKYDQALQEFSIAKKSIPNNKMLMGFVAAVHRRQGKFNLSLQGFKNILDLDPRNAPAADNVGGIYDALGKFAEAQRYFDLAISIGPDHSGAYWDKAASYLKFTGNTNQARAIIMRIPEVAERKKFLNRIEWFERNYEKGIELLPLEARTKFENYIYAGDFYRMMQKARMARESYEAARTELEQLVLKNPDDGSLHISLGFAYAGLDRKQEAIREANKAIELYPISKDAWVGPAIVRGQAIIYVMVGEYEAALDKIEYLLSIPSFGLISVSIPMLRVDPTWDPLRNHPRFKKILENHSQYQ